MNGQTDKNRCHIANAISFIKNQTRPTAKTASINPITTAAQPNFPTASRPKTMVNAAKPIRMSIMRTSYLWEIAQPLDLGSVKLIPTDQKRLLPSMIDHLLDGRPTPSLATR